MGCARGVAGTGVGERGEQPDGHARGDQCVPVGGGLDRLHQQFGSGVLEQEPAGARLEGAVHVLVEIEGGDHDDRHGSSTSGPASRRVASMPSMFGHADVEQAHVGSQPTGQRHRFAPVGCLADDLDVGLRVEDHPEPGADDLLIVGEEHADGHERPPPLGSTACTVHPRLRFGSGLEGAAEQLGPFGHADQPEP